LRKWRDMGREAIDRALERSYDAGFVTEIEQEYAPPGLSEEIIRFISAKKSEPDWLLEYRLKAYRRFIEMEEPKWAKVNYEPIDLQAISYYAVFKADEDRPKS